MICRCRGTRTINNRMGHGTTPPKRSGGAALLVAALAAIATLLACPGASARAAASLPSGFTETVVMSGLNNPTAVRFGPNGKVYVAEKAGIVKEFDGLADTTPRVVVDLRTKVMNFIDRGLLGLALPPDMTADRSVYVAYSLDAPIGGTPPVFNDACPPASTRNCVTGARVSRINVATGAEQKLVEDWCMQFSSHTIGSLVFAPDGALYVSGGEGADYNLPDWGQNGAPPNPCGDPPGGTALTKPTSQGGALRSQDVRGGADPVTLDGTILRIDPRTGAGKAGNPFASSGDANARRIIAYGLRNPFRMTLRPGTGELWFGEVGWGTIEEINRLVSPADATAENFGWPCFEGNWRQPLYQGLTLCDSLMAPQTVSPRFTYHHDRPVVAGENCPNGGASVSALAFTPPGGAYPAAYDGALFFGDYSRRCLWVLPKGADGLPNPAAVRVFATGASTPVDLQAGPGGVLYYADLLGGTIRRLSYSSTLPVAQFTATPSSGPAPLRVQFDASGSSDPNGDALSFAWDFDSNGTTDATGVKATRTFDQERVHVVTLRVTGGGQVSTATRRISVGVPVPAIASPAPGTQWVVGQPISFSGYAVDNDGARVPAQDLRWTVVLEHGACPSCHEHAISELTGASGTVSAPDHEYPSSILLRLTARDGELEASTTLRLQPRTVALTFATSPPGLRLGVDGETATAPITRNAIVGSAHSVEAAATQGRATFRGWSDGGARAHNILAPASPATYTARYSTPAAASGGTGPPGAKPKLRLTASGVRNAAADGTFRVRATCDTDCRFRLSGTAVVKTRDGRRTSRTKRLLRHEARSRSLATGVAKRFTVKLTPRGRRAARSALARHRKVVLVVRGRATNGAGTATKVRRVALRAPR
jgi:glucose/arabinose dehydrogenase